MSTHRQQTSAPEPPRRRLDQWLWFARIVKSRSMAARLCVAGAVAVNSVAVAKANQAVRVGDVVAVPRGRAWRAVRVRALGLRRGPAAEARGLYEDDPDAALPATLAEPWIPLLGLDDDAAHYDASDGGDAGRR